MPRRQTNANGRNKSGRTPHRKGNGNGRRATGIGRCRCQGGSGQGQKNSAG